MKTSPNFKPLALVLLTLGLDACAAHKPTCSADSIQPHVVQGNQDQSRLLGQSVRVSGVVTAVMPGLDGFFIQSELSDDSDLSSEGLYIHFKKKHQLKPGQSVLVKGTVSEEFDVTHLSEVETLEVCGSGTLPAATAISLPLSADELERFEGMRVRLVEPVYITDHYQFAKFGEITVSSQPHFALTQLHPANSKAAKEYQRFMNVDRLIIDDGRLAAHPQPFAAGPNGRPWDAKNRWKMGDQVVTEGVLHYAFGQFKLQPTQPVTLVQPVVTPTEPISPGGTWQVASFNLENLFTTLDQEEALCGPTGLFSCRGADSEQELERQLKKLVQVINRSDAAVVALQELENNQDQSIKTLVHALNQATGTQTWDYVDTGALGDDAIKVGIIYQPALVQPKGHFALLNPETVPGFKAHQHRIVVAQTFVPPSAPAFNVASVHLKSKSCRDAAGLNLNQKDGQGCYNHARQEGARLLGAWMNQDPTGQGAKLNILAGDFNSYQQEDPILALAKLGYHNLAKQFLGPKNWTTSYRGRLGSLDYVLVNSAAQQHATGISQWHINSIESGLFSYDQEPLGKGIGKPATFYQVTPTASSDHDLVVAGFQ